MYGLVSPARVNTLAQRKGPRIEFKVVETDPDDEQYTSLLRAIRLSTGKAIQ